MLKLLKSFIQPKYSREALEAYYYKLPNTINVNWFREDDYIIGEITSDDCKFLTQGRNADDFINMVNESLLTTYEIPDDYFEIIKKLRSYYPDSEQRTKLDNTSIPNSNFPIEKKILQPA